MTHQKVPFSIFVNHNGRIRKMKVTPVGNYYKVTIGHGPVVELYYDEKWHQRQIPLIEAEFASIISKEIERNLGADA